MSINIKIKEGGTERYFTADKLRTNLTSPTASKSTQDWIPEDSITLLEKEITENGEYTASDEGAHGYSKVTANVQFSLMSRTITENGVYAAADEDGDYEGYREVTVNVEGGGSGDSDVLRGPNPPSNSIGTDGQIYIQEGYDVTDTPSWMENLGYQRIPYLGVESRGPYLDLGSYQNLEGINAVFTFYTSTSMQECTGGIFGAEGEYNGTYVTSIYLLKSQKTSFSGQVYNQSKTRSTSDTTHSSDTGVNVYISYQGGSTKVTFTTNSSQHTYEAGDITSNNLYLFAINGGQKSDGVYLTKFDYTPSIESGTTYTYHLFPAVRVSDGKLGMVRQKVVEGTGEVVNVDFLTNQGTGRFVGEGGGLPTAVYYKQNGSWVIISSSLTAAEGVSF